MKLRLRENSIRLRLLQNEIKQLKDNGFVTEKIEFAPMQILTYTINVSKDITEIMAEFHVGEILIKIPENKAEQWVNTNTVGLEREQIVEGEKTLKILIEKDFVCVDRPLDQDNLDAFPHPKIIC